MEIITGAMTALITPFKNGKVDLQKYESLIKRQIAQGIDAVVPVLRVKVRLYHIVNIKSVLKLLLLFVKEVV